MKNRLLLLFGVLFLLGCSTRKNNFFTRNYHKITGQYNALYHGENALLKELESRKVGSVFKEDQILQMSPYTIEKIPFDQVVDLQEINQKASLFKEVKDSTEQEEVLSDMQIARNKAIKTIEEHSIQIKSKEFNPDVAKAYLLLAKTQYFQGEYIQGLTSLNYIEKNLSDYKDFHQVYLWLGLHHGALENPEKAQEYFNKLIKEKTTRKQRAENLSYYAQHLIQTQNWQSAYDLLEANKEVFPRKEQDKIKFVQGQLLEKLGQTDKATAVFMAFDQKKKSAYFEDSKVELAKLYPANTGNFDKIENQWLALASEKNTTENKQATLYYALAKAAQRAGLSEKESLYLSKTLALSKDNPAFKASIYQSKAEVLYKQKDYYSASLYFDSAASQNVNQSESYRDKQLVLKNLVEKQDSLREIQTLLALQKLEPEAQLEQINQLIEQAKQKSQKSSPQGTESQKEKSVEKETSAWYFYNPELLESGKKAFAQKWGDLAWKADWKFERSLKQNQSTEQIQEQSSTETPLEQTQTAAYWQNKIPTSPEQIKALNLEKEALSFDIFEIFDQKLKDKTSSVQTLESLLSSGVESSLIKQRTYYQLYKLTLEEKYKKQLIEEYPGSVFAQKLSENSESSSSASKEKAQEIYEKALQAYQNKKYDIAGEELKKIQNLSTQKDSQWGPKIEFLGGMILLKQNLLSSSDQSVEEMKARFQGLILDYPGSEEAIKAKEILETIKNQNP
ncbi:MAG: hypothetical protein C4K58_01120 [Flavobacteriaceae bacterium]|nr:MAG: hypothetical protein C4K58_01120 [Flavobacteriaceae bacterium]